MVGQVAHLEDYSRKTIQDCIDLQREKQAVILDNGTITGFEEEEENNSEE